MFYFSIKCYFSFFFKTFAAVSTKDPSLSPVCSGTQTSFSSVVEKRPETSFSSDAGGSRRFVSRWTDQSETPASPRFETDSEIASASARVTLSNGILLQPIGMPHTI